MGSDNTSSPEEKKTSINLQKNDALKKNKNWGAIKNGISISIDFIQTIILGYGLYLANEELSVHKSEYNLNINNFPTLTINSFREQCDGDCINGFGTLYYSNGDIYIGNFKDTLKEGEGRYLFVNGSFYNGNYYKDFMNGTGEFHFADGRTYRGEFKYGFIDGKGVLITEKGESINGDWVYGTLLNK